MIDVRRTLIQVETINHEFGPRPAKPQRRLRRTDNLRDAAPLGYKRTSRLSNLPPA